MNLFDLQKQIYKLHHLGKKEIKNKMRQGLDQHDQFR